MKIKKIGQKAFRLEHIFGIKQVITHVRKFIESQEIAHQIWHMIIFEWAITWHFSFSKFENVDFSFIMYLASCNNEKRSVTFETKTKHQINGIFARHPKFPYQIKWSEKKK